MQIPAQLISIDYLLDPTTEDIAFSGDELKEGMIVLIENVLSRYYTGTPLENLSTGDRHRHLTSSRWCKIERLDTSGQFTRFIGVYADGSKCVRSYPKSCAWIVKLNSASAE